MYLVLLPLAQALGEMKHPTSLGRWNTMKVKFTTYYLLWEEPHLLDRQGDAVSSDEDLISDL